MPTTPSVFVAPKDPSRALARGSALALVQVVSLFFLWGVANNLNDILIKQFKNAFELTDFQSGLVQSAFYLGYFLFALPAGLFMRRYGYKGGIVFGLFLYAIGTFLFYPAASARTYSFFLIALFVIASGLAFLETSANPFMTVLGSPEGAERRLNLAQAFNPLGSITGVLIGRFFIFSGVEYTPQQMAAMSPAAKNAYLAAESAAVRTPYLTLGVLVALLGVAIVFTRFPSLPADAPPGDAARGAWRELLHRQRFLFAVIAQFFYVGAQVGIWSYLIRYTQATVPGVSEKSAADLLVLSLVLFMLGRFAGAALMRLIAPSKLLAACALVNAALLAIAVASPGRPGIASLIASSFFMSLMFPTIFALGIHGLGELRKLASSVLVMAIIGGAILTPLMGGLSAIGGIHWSMAVPLCCFGIIFAFASYARRAESGRPQQGAAAH
jgi:MFS transporter, FHS family, L-fucose permease